MADLVCGIDLGGTKIEAALINFESIKVEYKIRLPTGAKEGYDFVLQQICNAVSLLEQESGMQINQVGLATPGTTDPASGRLMNCNAVCLNGRMLKTDLERKTDKQFFLANDANCFALAEACYGAAAALQAKPEVVFGIILGTGVGGGLVLQGKCWQGAHGIAGEWGHQVLDSDGQLCYCGRTGCNETFFSGPALERYYLNLSGKSVDLRYIAHAALQGKDQFAEKTIHFMLQHLGRALGGVINILDPDVLVIGGGLSQIDALYTELRSYIKPWVFHPDWNGRILAPKLGDSAGIYGAAELVRNH